MKLHLWITKTEYENDSDVYVWTEKPNLVPADEFVPEHYSHLSGAVSLCIEKMRLLLRGTGKRLPKTHKSIVEIDVWAK